MTINIQGKEFRGHYANIGTDFLVASHDYQTFARNYDFPCDNDRDYANDHNAQEVVMRMSMDFDSRAYDNPPVVVRSPSFKYYVLSGNNRVMAYNRAIRNGICKKYRDAFTAHGEAGEEYEMGKMRVFVLDDGQVDAITPKLLALFNQSEEKVMTPIEKAISVSKVMTHDDKEAVFALVDTASESTADLYNQKNVSVFFKRLEDREIMSHMETIGLLTDDGITETGKIFVGSLITGMLFSAETIRLLDTMPVIKTKILKKSGLLANIGGMGKYNVLPQFEQAIAFYQKANAAGYTPGDMADQGTLFGEKVPHAIIVELATRIGLKYDDYRKFITALYQDLLEAYQGNGDIFAGGIKSVKQILCENLKVAHDVAPLETAPEQPIVKEEVKEEETMAEEYTVLPPPQQTVVPTSCIVFDSHSSIEEVREKLMAAPAPKKTTVAPKVAPPTPKRPEISYEVNHVYNGIKVIGSYLGQKYKIKLDGKPMWLLPAELKAIIDKAEQKTPVAKPAVKAVANPVAKAPEADIAAEPTVAYAPNKAERVKEIEKEIDAYKAEVELLIARIKGKKRELEILTGEESKEETAMTASKPIAESSPNLPSPPKEDAKPKKQKAAKEKGIPEIIDSVLTGVYWYKETANLKMLKYRGQQDVNARAWLQNNGWKWSSALFAWVCNK